MGNKQRSLRQQQVSTNLEKKNEKTQLPLTFLSKSFRNVFAQSKAASSWTTGQRRRNDGHGERNSFRKALRQTTTDTLSSCKLKENQTKPKRHHQYASRTSVPTRSRRASLSTQRPSASPAHRASAATPFLVASNSRSASFSSCFRQLACRCCKVPPRCLFVPSDVQMSTRQHHNSSHV